MITRSSSSLCFGCRLLSQVLAVFFPSGVNNSSRRSLIFFPGLREMRLCLDQNLNWSGFCGGLSTAGLFFWLFFDFRSLSFRALGFFFRAWPGDRSLMEFRIFGCVSWWSCRVGVCFQGQSWPSLQMIGDYGLPPDTCLENSYKNLGMYHAMHAGQQSYQSFWDSQSIHLLERACCGVGCWWRFCIGRSCFSSLLIPYLFFYRRTIYICAEK